MSNMWDAVPVVSQMKSLWQACVRDMEGARVTQETYSIVCPIVSQLRSLVEVSMGDVDSARRTQETFSSICWSGWALCHNDCVPQCRRGDFSNHHYGVI